MNLCSDGHDEIVYAGRLCPACEAIAENKELIEAHETSEKQYEGRIGELEERNEELESALRGDLKLNTVMQLITDPKYENTESD